MATVHDATVVIGLLALLEGTHEFSEAAFALVDNVGPAPVRSHQRQSHDAADEAQERPIVDTSVEARADTHHRDVREDRLSTPPLFTAGSFR